MHQPAVDVVYDCVDDVSEDKCPGSSQAVLHLSEQQVDKQVIHEQNTMTFIAVGRLFCPFTHRQQNLLDRNLQCKNRRYYKIHYINRKYNSMHSFKNNENADDEQWQDKKFH